MESRYKAIISGKNIYKEIDLSPDDAMVRVGTLPESDVRLRKELFFAPIEITFHHDDGDWNILCSDNLYFTIGDVRKLLTKKLSHGDSFLVRYQESNTDVFSVSFIIDFDYEQKDYNVVIDLGDKSSVTIGGAPEADILVQSEFVSSDTFSLIRENDGLYVIDNQTKYGVSVNGSRIDRRKKVFSCDFISMVDFSFYYKNGKLYCPSYSNMEIRGLDYAPAQIHSTHFEYPKFNRNSRIKYVIPKDELEIQQAAPKPQKPKKNLAMSLIPAFVMLALTIVLRGILGRGGTFVIYSAASMTMGIIMSIVSFFEDKKNYKTEFAERIAHYNDYIEEKRHAIEASRENEIRIRNLIYESLDNSIAEVDSFGKRLFERAYGDEDYLQIYLGKGTLESSNQVQYPVQEFIDLEDPLATVPKTVAEEYRYIHDVPITSDFFGSCGIGVVGSAGMIEQAIKNMTIDIGVRHFYNDVKLVYILNDALGKNLSWVRWLKNVENSRLDIRNIAVDEESKNIILEDLYFILSERETLAEQTKEICFTEQYVVFVTGASSIAAHPISKYFKNCVNYGFTFVFLEEYEEFIPQGCSEIIRISGEEQGVAIKTENGDLMTEFAFPFVSDETASELAIKLGAVSVDEVSLEGELTKNITMFEMLGILSVEDIDLSRRWDASEVYRSLAAPLGVKSKNQTVYLDISDKAGAHGPHGLVAGTTGSGKSEVLQTYILSMSTLFHPYEVGFVIIDFKGGGMANQFKDLPHLIGTITNIDGREINRSLLSIKAELVKRQELFSEAGVNHINDYIKLYKAKKVAAPLPHLIMIVDEFAELKAEYPDFMKELISAARIGRTLGVHLILATQKPAGVVDAQIWSNSRFKLCLKVQTKEDSNEVIKTPLAAEIVEPGRAYFQVGNNETFELFQSAYSGAAIPEGNETKDRIFTLYEKNLWGRRRLIYTNKRAKTEANSMTQLQAIVDHVHGYCLDHGIDKLPGICLPALKDRIGTDELSYGDTGSGMIVPIGIYDDPEQQRQGEISIEPSRENVYIVGSPQMGKTVMLQTAIYGIIRKYSPQQVNLYLIDCGSMVLKIFEESKHVGGVVLSNEEEKCKNLFKLLNTAVIQRKKILSNKGVGNYAAYLDAGFHDMPLIVVVIDNMAAFKEYYPNESDMINSLAREAQGVGISFIVTAAASNALSYRTQSNFGKKIVLNCNDTNEYSNVFGHCKDTPKEVAGRGLCMLDRRILEYQTAVFGKSLKEADRSQEMKDYIEARNRECAGQAIQIPMVPDALKLHEAMADNPGVFRNSGILPIGMDFATVDYSMLNVHENGVLALLGDNEARERFVKCLLKAISQTVVFHGIEAVVVDDKNKRLAEADKMGFVRSYSSDTAEGIQKVEEFCDSVEHLHEHESAAEGIHMLIISSQDVFRRLLSDKRQSKMLSDAIKYANEVGSFILLAAVENQAVGFNSSEALKAVKEGRQAILFAPLSENKMFEVSARIKSDSTFDSTMAYRFDGSTYSKIKLFE